MILKFNFYHPPTSHVVSFGLHVDGEIFQTKNELVLIQDGKSSTMILEPYKTRHELYIHNPYKIMHDNKMIDILTM